MTTSGSGLWWMVMFLPSNSYRESGKTGEAMGRLSAKRRDGEKARR